MAGFACAGRWIGVVAVVLPLGALIWRFSTAPAGQAIADTKDVLLLIVGVISVGALGAAIYKAWRSDNKSALTLATIFVLSAFISSTPLIETFKAVGVEVSLRKSLDRADEILIQIRKASATSAASTYLLTTSAGRIGGLSREDKQKLLDSVNDQMKAAGVPDSEVATIVTSHLQGIAFELYAIFYNTVSSASAAARKKEPSSPAVKEFDDGMYKRMTGNPLEMVYEHAATGGSFSAFMKEQVAAAPFPKEDVAKLGILADRLGETFEGCRKAQGYTRESFEFLRFYDRIRDSTQTENYYPALQALK